MKPWFEGGGLCFCRGVLIAVVLLTPGVGAGTPEGGKGTNSAAVVPGSKSGVRRRPPATAPQFALRDQFDRPLGLQFPRKLPTVLTVADRAGSKQVDGWVRAVTSEFGAGVVVDGLADLSAVPGWLRSSVREHFTEELPHPIMLDWEGYAARAFEYEPGHANVYLIDREGKILHWTHGAATSNEVRRLSVALKAAVGAPTESSQPAKP